MKIFIACSKWHYGKIPEIKENLERRGHQVSMPNSFDNPLKEEELKKLSKEEHIKWKSEMLKKDSVNISPNDAILVLNFEKNGQPDYIGGATFLEIAKAWEMDKKVFLFNNIPDSIFKEELIRMSPIIINGNLDLIN